MLVCDSPEELPRREPDLTDSLPDPIEDGHRRWKQSDLAWLNSLVRLPVHLGRPEDQPLLLDVDLQTAPVESAERMILLPCQDTALGPQILAHYPYPALFMTRAGNRAYWWAIWIPRPEAPMRAEARPPLK